MLVFGLAWGVPALITTGVFVAVSLRLFGRFLPLPIGVSLIGLGLTWAGAARRSKARAVYRDGACAVGFVNLVRRGNGRGRNRTYWFEYVLLQNGAPFAAGSFRTRRPPHPGDLIWVAYDPARPDSNLPIFGWPEIADPNAFMAGRQSAIAARPIIPV